MTEFHEMSDEEFLETIRAEIAEKLDLTKEEVEEMSISDIEDEHGVDDWEIRKEKSRLGGLLVFDDDPYDYLTRGELKEREEEVEEYLQRF